MPSTLASRRWRNWLQQLAGPASGREGGRGLSGMGGAQMETERLGTEVTMAGGPGSQQAGLRGPWDSRASFLCGTICSHSTCLFSRGLLKESGQLLISLERGGENCGVEVDLHARGQGSCTSLSTEDSAFFPCSFLGASSLMSH